MTLVDAYVVCEKNSHEMTPVVVSEKNTHAMTLGVVTRKNTHAMTLVDPCVVSEENTHFNDTIYQTKQLRQNMHKVNTNGNTKIMQNMQACKMENLLHKLL